MSVSGEKLCKIVLVNRLQDLACPGKVWSGYSSRLPKVAVLSVTARFAIPFLRYTSPSSLLSIPDWILRVRVQLPMESEFCS